MTRGRFSAAQVTQLLRAINPNRVLSLDGHAYLGQHDVRAHLTRVLGFGGYDIEVVELTLVFEDGRERTRKNAREGQSPTFFGWDVAYRARVRLVVRNPEGELVATYEDVSTGDAQAQPGRAGAHDLAAKSAVSTAMKRAATHLGDQFGLSLYSKRPPRDGLAGWARALVATVLVGGPQRDEQAERTDPRDDVQAGMERDPGTGLDDAAMSEGDPAPGEQPDEAPEAPEQPPAPQQRPRRAVAGQQGTRRPQPAQVAEPTPPAPAVEQGSGRDWSGEVEGARDTRVLAGLWTEAEAFGELDAALRSQLLQRQVDLNSEAERAAAEAKAEPDAPAAE